MLPQQYCLRWKYHHSNLQTMFSQLLDRGCFCDVTLACEGQLLRAHRVVLCACSTFFDTILTNYSTERDPIMILKDAKYGDVKCLIEFMYKGEINVDHENLASLLKTAEELKIKGLAEVSWRDDEQDNPVEPEPEPEIKRHESKHHHHQQMRSEEHHNHRSSRMPLLTPIPSPNHQENSHAGPKRKRGRPPLDETYDHYSTPKIAYVEGAIAPFSEGPLIVDPPCIEEVSIGKDNEPEPQPAEEWVNGANMDVNVECEREEKPNPEQLNKEASSDVNSDLCDPEYVPEEEIEQEVTETKASTIGLTTEELEEWQDVVKMDDYLANGRRPQFWEEPFTRRVMEAIKCKKLEMKKASQILGVSYGTLYGRYRETYGCLKHPYRIKAARMRYRRHMAKIKKFSNRPIYKFNR